MALFIFAGVYQILVSFWALSRRNIIQLFMLVFFAFAMLIYGGIQYDQIGETALHLPVTRWLTARQIRSLIIAIPCILAAEALILLSMTYMLYKEYNIVIFEKLGPDKNIKRALRDLLLFETIILFDFFFFVGFTLQFVFIILETKDVEFGLTIAVIPVTAIVLIVAVVCVYKEIKQVVYMFFIVLAAGLAYFIFKMCRIYTTTGRKHVQYMKARKTLTVFAVITIAFLLITIIYTIQVLRNFGKGLKGRNKVFRANDQYQQEIDLGGPTDIADTEMDQVSRDRSLSIQSSLHTLASVGSMRSLDSGLNGGGKMDKIPNSVHRPVYSDTGSTQDSKKNNNNSQNHRVDTNNSDYDNSGYYPSTSLTSPRYSDDDREGLVPHHNQYNQSSSQPSSSSAAAATTSAASAPSQNNQQPYLQNPLNPTRSYKGNDFSDFSESTHPNNNSNLAHDTSFATPRATNKRNPNTFNSPNTPESMMVAPGYTEPI